MPLSRQIITFHAPDEFKSNLVCELKPLQNYYLQWGDAKVLKMVRTLSALAIFILLLVVANFISIMISGSSNRLREIGLRKLFGGFRRQLISQFLIESILTALLSMLLAFILYILLRPVFQHLLDKPLVAIHEFGVSVFFWILVISVLIGCVAGIEPIP